MSHTGDEPNFISGSECCAGGMPQHDSQAWFILGYSHSVCSVSCTKRLPTQSTVQTHNALQHNAMWACRFSVQDTSYKSVCITSVMQTLVINQAFKLHYLASTRQNWLNQPCSYSISQTKIPWMTTVAIYMTVMVRIHTDERSETVKARSGYWWPVNVLGSAKRDKEH